MTKKLENYSLISEQELVERLIAVPVDEKLHDFFLRKICRRILKHISLRIFNHPDDTELWGEFYEFISRNNWAVLRKWEGKNGASLTTYLSYCATNYFVHRQLADKKLEERFVSVSSHEDSSLFVDECDDDNEEQYTQQQVWDAFYALNERDRTILQELVIDGRSALEAAPVIWEYIKSEKSLSEISPKRVQCTIAMAKSRAQLALFSNLRRLEKRFVSDRE